MKALFMAVGTCKMGMTKRDKAGNVIEQRGASFEPDPEGGCVVIGKANITCADVIQQDGPAAVFGDWDAAGYLAKVVEILQPRRKLNIPDLREIVRAAAEDGNKDFFCEYCDGLNCADCIITQWWEEFEEADG